jgi:homoserine acetyltransferase
MTHRDPSVHAPLLKALGEAALALCVEKSWADVSLLGLCQEAGQSLSDCAEAGITRFSIAEYLDQMLDIIMARFDAMQEHHAAWVSILEADAQEPAAGFARAARRLRTAAWALEAVGVSTDSLKATARVMGLARRLRKIEALWLKDDADLSKTMAGLDQTLRESEEWLDRGEKLAEFLKSGSLRRTRSKAADEHSPEDPQA